MIPLKELRDVARWASLGRGFLSEMVTSEKVLSQDPHGALEKALPPLDPTDLSEICSARDGTIDTVGPKPYRAL